MVFLQHRNTTTNNQQQVVTDCLLLASADYIIKGRSSVSDIALLFNKRRKVNFTFILNDDDMWQFSGDDLLRTGPYKKENEFPMLP